MISRICFVAVLLLASYSLAADDPSEKAATPAANAVAAASDQYFASGSMSFRERRQLGLTIPKIAGALKDLQKEGELEPDMDRSLVAAMVLERLAAEEPKAYSAPNLDLDAILAFIEKLLPLIMTIIGMFS